EDGSTYQSLCRCGDVEGVNSLLTDETVEERVLRRAFIKASAYGQDINVLSTSEETVYKVDPQIISNIYRDLVIPLTKDAEILYLFQRTGCPCPPLEGIHNR
ncbi:unnamed protein product, partial [Discosporangium mesarthrocarpum]